MKTFTDVKIIILITYISSHIRKIECIDKLQAQTRLPKYEAIGDRYML